MHVAVNLLDTRAGANLIDSVLIPPGLRNGVRKRCYQYYERQQNRCFRSKNSSCYTSDWRPVYPGLFLLHTTSSRQHVSRHCLYGPIYSRNFPFGKKGGTAVLATSSNPDKPKTRFQHQQYSKHVQKSQANRKKVEKTSVVRVVRQTVLKSNHNIA